MSDPANAGMKAALDGWHTRCSRLATYDYALLQENETTLPVPLVAGTVDRAQYLASIGALDGLCQATLDILPYNPWNFYAYPRIRWNTNQTAGQLEMEFFNGYFREAAAPMLAYYQGLENYQVTNGINMHYVYYYYGINPGAFPLNVLAAMQTNLQAAELAATNWYVIKRLAYIRSGFIWSITNAGFSEVGWTNMALYPTVGSTTNPYTAILTNVWWDAPHWNGLWTFYGGGKLEGYFSVAIAGTYTVAITARRAAALSIWPIMNVYFGPKNGSLSVNTATNSTYNFTFTVPAGVWNLDVIYNGNAPSYGQDAMYVSKIQITRQ
jgi:hypothetical protein